MKDIINKLRNTLESFFNVIPGYFNVKEEIFNLINRLEEYDSTRQRN
jgi:hypothetical protein